MGKIFFENNVFLDGSSGVGVYCRKKGGVRMKLGCVIMAAGESRRFGGNKLAAVIEGKPLYQRALEAVPSGVFERVVVVTGQTVIAEAAERMGFCPVENREPGLGVSRTIRLGLEALGDVDGALFMTADQPFLTSDTLCALASAFGGEEIVAAAHKGERGILASFPEKFSRRCCPSPVTPAAEELSRRTPNA